MRPQDLKGGGVRKVFGAMDEEKNNGDAGASAGGSVPKLGGASDVGVPAAHGAGSAAKSHGRREKPSAGAESRAAAGGETAKKEKGEKLDGEAAGKKEKAVKSGKPSGSEKLDDGKSGADKGAGKAASVSKQPDAEKTGGKKAAHEAGGGKQDGGEKAKIEKAAKPKKEGKPADEGSGEQKSRKGELVLEEGKPRGPKEPPRLLVKYRKEVLPKLKEKYGRKNDLACARLKKICVNTGFGKMLGATANEADKTKIIEETLRDLALITGQKAVITLARKSVSNFKVRKGFRVGACVTLRGARMYEFFDRLVSVAIPRIRDFRGISPRSFDGRGNFSLGLQEKTIFPEVDMDKVNYHQGLQITMVTTAKTDEEARDLLKWLGMPFRDN